MDRREHRRAKLSLPVRLRWSNPFGQKTEICETLDVSRGGLLVPCVEPHDPGVALWVTFPYDSSLGNGQPEVFAKVVRATGRQNGTQVPATRHSRQIPSEPANGFAESAVALHFEPLKRMEGNGVGNGGAVERRRSVRRALAAPIRVRPHHVPWFEEAMTMDVSGGGLRFLSSREYELGEELFISFQPTGRLSGNEAAEFRAQVVRAAPVPGGSALGIGVRRLS